MTTEVLERLRTVIELEGDRVDEVHVPLFPKQLELPLWPSGIQSDAEFAWRYVDGFPVRVRLVDVDTLTTKNYDQTGRQRRGAKLRITLEVSDEGRKATQVRRGGRRLGEMILKRFAGPKPTPKHTVDHIDRNPLNNARENLRWATRREQTLNSSPRGSSKFLYVYSRNGRWGAVVRDVSLGKNFYNGVYATEQEAARAGDVLALQVLGPTARTNVSEGLLPPIEQQLELAV